MADVPDEKVWHGSVRLLYEYPAVTSSGLGVAVAGEGFPYATSPAPARGNNPPQREAFPLTIHRWYSWMRRWQRIVTVNITGGYW